MNHNIKKYTVAFPFKYSRAKFCIKKLSEWGVIDYVFLKELSLKNYSLQELCTYSNLEKQIVIQILLPMMKIGWIELLTNNADFYFVITELGKIACKENKLPDKEEDYDRNRDFLIDFNNNYYGIQKLRLIPEVEVRINELQKTQNNFIKFTIPRFEVYPNYNLMYKAVEFNNEKIINILDDFHFGINDTKYILFDIHYNKSKNQVFFHDEELISKFSKDVRDTISQFNFSEIKDKKLIRKDFNLPKFDFNSSYKFEIDNDSLDMVLGAKAHQEAVINLIKESDEYLIIHSTFIGKWCIKNKENEYTNVFNELKNALKRNVNVYILWGKDEPDEFDDNFEKSKLEISDVEALLNEFNDKCIKDGILNTINFNNFSKTGSHTKFIISKTSKDVKLFFSSCNFLYTEYLRFESALLITDNTFIKNFLCIAADISSGKDLHSGSIRNDFIQFSKNIPDSLVLSTNKIKVNLVLKYQHYDYIDLAKKTCRNRLYILSDKLNDVASRPIADALKNSSFKKYAFFSQRSEKFTPEMEKIFTQNLLKSPININLKLHNPKNRLETGKIPKKNHSKVLAWDNNNILITSLNWLSSNASKSSSSTDIYHEIGIYVEKRDIAKNFINTFNSL